MNESALESQEGAMTWKAKEEDTGNEDDKQALDDIGHNADLYISRSSQVVVQDF